jgi:hypothetical protein
MGLGWGDEPAVGARPGVVRCPTSEVGLGGLPFIAEHSAPTCFLPSASWRAYLFPNYVPSYIKIVPYYYLVQK